MTERIRVVLLGTPDFAVPTLKALAESEFAQVVLVVTQPDKPVGRKHALFASPVKEAALEYGLPLAQPERVSSASFVEYLLSQNADVLVTAAYGQILSTKVLGAASLGCLNVHASLLPRWRGAAPIHRAIIAGDEQTGVTIMKTVRELDAGPVLGMETVPITETDTVGSLHDRLATVGARLLVRLLPDYAAGRLVATEQEQTGITYAHRIVRADEWVDFTLPQSVVHNHIRGLSPWPGATAVFSGQPIKLWQSRLTGDGRLDIQDDGAGTVAMTSDGLVCVRCRDGWLELLEVQPAGKRRMPAGDWFRGQRTREMRLETVEDIE